MTNFCGYCGSRLNESGICPMCNNTTAQADTETFDNDDEITGALTPEAAPVSMANVPSQQSSDAQDAYFEQANGDYSGAQFYSANAQDARFEQANGKPENPINPTNAKKPGRKRKGLFVKIISLFLVAVILIGVGAGTLTYFDCIDFPFLEDFMAKLGIVREAESTEVYKTLTGKFTEIRIVDEASAISAAKEAARELNLEDAAKELTAVSASPANGFTYYRLQQNYNGVPVLGRAMVVVADESGTAQGISSNATEFDDEVKMSTSATASEIITSVNSYTSSNHSFSFTEEQLTNALSKDNYCIFNLNDVADIRYAYSLSIECDMVCYTVIVDANTAEVLQFDDGMYAAQESYTYAGQLTDRTFFADKRETESIMEYVSDSGVVISVFTPVDGHVYDWYYAQNRDYVRWANDGTPDPAAVDAMASIQGIYSYYKDSFGMDLFNVENTHLDVYINTRGYLKADKTQEDLVNNAYFWSAPNGRPLISFTIRYDESGALIPEYSSAIDVVGHEYTHGVVSHTSHLCDTDFNHHPDAINEAVADIMGYCAEASLTGKEIDWISPVRTSLTGHELSAGQTYHYDNYKHTDDCHTSSTIISRAAYLMHKSSGSDSALSTKELEDLWYKVLISLPSDATFSDVRANVVFNAGVLGYSDDKLECINKAFDEVGVLFTDDTVREYSSDAKLIATDINGKLCDDYTLEIVGTEYTGLFKTGLFKKDYKSKQTVSRAKELKLKLNRGDYTLKVTNNFDPTQTASLKIKIRNVKDGVINLKTGFGFDYTISNDAMLHVYDMNDISYYNYSASISGSYENENGDKITYSNQYTATPDTPFNMNLSDGKYNFVLTDGLDSTKTKRFSVEVSSGAANELNIPTHFGEKAGKFTADKLPADAREYNGHYYYIDSALNSWAYAAESCRNKGGYLATVTDAGEQAFIQEYITEYANDISEEKLKKIQYTGAQNISDNENLLTDGEENLLAATIGKVHDSYNGADIVLLTTPSLGVSVAYDYAYRYYLQSFYGKNVIMLVGSKTLSTWQAFGFGSLSQYSTVLTNNLSLYVMPHINSGSYYAAFNTFIEKCMGYLGTPKELTVTTELQVWLGASYDNAASEWFWANDEAFRYTNWAANQPDNYYSANYACISNYVINDGGDTINIGEWYTDSSIADYFVCEWGEYTPEPDEFIVSHTAGRSTSDERDVVLVLDTSGSMEGEPIEETKEAAKKFVDTVLEQDASIGIVTYSGSATMCSDFSTNAEYLTTIIDDIYSDGNTNIESGLSFAQSMLSNSNARKKIIVLMSDGMPNDGKQGDSLIAYADEIKEAGTYLYTLGFFENTSYELADAQALMEALASAGCHYEVSSAEDLVFFFGDIADQINGQQYIYIRIACPVDVYVEFNGECLDSGKEDDNVRTSFGSLTYEENPNVDAEEEDADDRIKVLRLYAENEYDVLIEGTGRGKMSYTIAFMDENGEYSDFRKFSSIRITKDTVVTTLANRDDTTTLEVDEDGDGKCDLRYVAAANERGRLVEDSPVVYIVIAAVAVLAAAITIIGIIINKSAKRKMNGGTQNV